ncbi:MAG TPA: hypothetical protein VM684_00720, partial [Gaiellales bacterium]|nr:hypothetical protein [Gaiellales bacterium]
MAKLVWRVRLVAELEPGVVTETELARIERDAQASLAELGLRLDEAKRLTAALQAQLVPAQVAALGKSCRLCEACGRVLVSKGHYGATFRSLFGDVPVRVRRRLACPCRGAAAVKSCTVLELGKDALAPELAYVTARYAALAPFGKVAALLSELLPLGGVQHAGTVRDRTIVQVAVIPRTLSGKITELAVRDVIPGRPVRNTEGARRPAGARARQGLVGAAGMTGTGDPAGCVIPPGETVGCSRRGATELRHGRREERRLLLHAEQVVVVDT